MVKVGLFVRLEAASGKEAALADFLKQGQALVEAEPGTTGVVRGPDGPVRRSPSSTPSRTSPAARRT